MAKKSKIAVLGGGNGAHAMAADLTLKGFEVSICEAPQLKEGFSTVLEQKKICLIDTSGNENVAKVSEATTDFEKALKGAGFVMMTLPANWQETFFAAIMPHLESDQIIVIWAGNCASLLFSKMIRESGKAKDVIFAESSTLPFGCRLEAPARVKIFFEVPDIRFAAFPGQLTDRIAKEIQRFYPVVASENVVATTLNNLNPVFHPAPMILNTGWIETKKGDFYFYKDAMTPSVVRVMKTLYDEVTSLATAVEIKMKERPVMLDHPERWLNLQISNIKGPSSLKDRFISEDVKFGLVLISDIASKFNVATPVIDSIVELASVVNGTRYMQEGRSLEKLGLAGMTSDELKCVLKEGFGALK